MPSIFLSYSFNKNDRDLAARLQSLIESHGIKVLSGKRLAGGELAPGIQERIRDADALVGLMTRRDKIEGREEWRTHDWVIEEMGIAEGTQRRCFVILENGVKPPGSTPLRQYIQFDREEQLDAFLDLSENIGQWKQQTGRTVNVQILPKALADKVRKGTYECEYRLQGKDRPSAHAGTDPVPTPAGTYVVVGGVQDDHLIQLQVRSRAWISGFCVLPTIVRFPARYTGQARRWS
jgi:hypothetical protein